MSFRGLLFLSAWMFATGIFGILSRRHVVALVLSIELLFNGANLALLSFAWAYGVLSAASLAFLGIAVTVAEVAVGLAIFLLVVRLSGTAAADELAGLRG